ncbi:putative secreted effector protein [Blumeria graminis f. sp. tritici 96224]|nr:putative secreted effector protein [Blumeria graminis f. sp. tritici 96224]
MKTFVPKIAIVLFSLVVPALADGWTCAGRNVKGDDVRAQARHWVGLSDTRFSEFEIKGGVQLCYIEIGEGAQTTKGKCT